MIVLLLWSKALSPWSLLPRHQGKIYETEGSDEKTLSLWLLPRPVLTGESAGSDENIMPGTVAQAPQNLLKVPEERGAAKSYHH